MDTMDTTRTVTIGELIQFAGWLASEDGENGEYDRALAELITDAAGLDMISKDDVAGAIRAAKEGKS